ncbi:MAG: hypothetical protein ABIC95_05900 [archaeon]
MKTTIIMILALLFVPAAMAATLTCQQTTDASLSIPQFSSQNVEITCTASGGTVSTIQISPNPDPSTGLTFTSSQTMSSSLTDQETGTATWSVTGDSPNTYSVSYTLLSDGTNSWTGAQTTSIVVPSAAQLTVEYVLPPALFTPAVETLDFKINNIGGTTANDVKIQLDDGTIRDYPVTIGAGASSAYSWTNTTGFNTSGTYTTKVYIGSVLHDSATAQVLTSSEGNNMTANWNLISLVEEPADLSVSSVLTGANWSSVWAWNTGLKSFQQSIWTEDGPAGPLTTFEMNRGYWVLFNEAFTLNLDGSVPSNHNISLATEWNLIGYSSDSAATATTILTGLNYSSLWMWNESANAGAGGWKSHLIIDGTVVGPLETFHPGYGYWIDMNEAGNLVY